MHRAKTMRKTDAGDPHVFVLSNHSQGQTCNRNKVTRNLNLNITNISGFSGIENETLICDVPQYTQPHTYMATESEISLAFQL